MCTVIAHNLVFIFSIGEWDHSQMIDAAVVSEVCQKLSVTSDEVIHAVRSEDGSNHLAIAYELVRDNR